MQFNVGFYEFSKNVGMNFQLNRFYSMGVLEKAELVEIGKERRILKNGSRCLRKPGKKLPGKAIT